MRLLLAVGSPRDRDLATRAFGGQWHELEHLEASDESSFEGLLTRDEVDLVVASDELDWIEGAELLRITRARWPRSVSILLGLAGPHAAGVLRSPRAAQLLLAVARAGLADASPQHAGPRGCAEEQRLRVLLESGPFAVHTLDRRCRLLQANAAGLALVEAERRGEVVGRSILRLIAPRWRRDFAALTRAAFGGEGGALEFELHGLRGARRRVRASAAPLPGSGGCVHECVLALRELGAARTDADVGVAQEDASALRRQEELSRQTQRLESLELLAGGVAHEFNNALTGILGFSELLLRKLDDESERQMVHSIRDSGRNAVRLTQQLLVFGRRHETETFLLAPDELIRGFTRLIEGLIGEQMTLELALASGSALVRADPGQLEQALVNLVINARDAMPDGGKLVIATRVLELSAEQARDLGLGQARSFVAIEVRDQGLGLEPEVLAHVFEPFFTTKDPDQGSGLGLAMVHGIVRRSDGAITVESRAGAGATFRILLPRFEGQPEWPAPGTSVQTSPPGTETILVVEDERAVLELMSAILAPLGYHVLLASDARTAFALAAGHSGRIDLLVSDVMLPGLDGYRLAELLSAQHGIARHLFVSGHDTVCPIPEESRFERLLKPFSPSALARAVRRSLDGSAAGNARPRRGP